MWADVIEKALNNPRPVKHLSLKGQQLNRFRAIIWQSFPLLEVLDLSQNNIKSIPKGILKLRYLKRLVIADNQIATLPSFLRELECLKVLDVQNNRLTKVDALPVSLEVLNLSRNKLKTFPASIADHLNLLHLDLSHNSLKTTPDLKDNLQALQYLNLGHCQLQKIGLLPTRLRALFLAKNSLKTLANNIYELNELQRFDIAANPINISAEEKISSLFWQQLSYIDVRKTKTKWPSVLWLLEQFPKLEHSLGGLSRQKQKDFSTLIQLCPQKPTAFSAADVYLLLKGKNDARFNEKMLALCFEDGVHPAIQAAAFRAYLKNHAFISRKAIKGLRFAIVGDVFQDKVKLEKRLQQQGAFLVETSIAADVLVLGHENWEKTHFIHSKSVLDERLLTNYLDKKEGRYLTYTKDKKQLANVSRLLKSKDEASFNLGLSLLKSWGTPQIVLVQLLERWINGNTTQKAKLSSVLRPYLPTEINILLSANRPTLMPFAGKRWIKTLWNLL